jgi:shikimate dehydrogenase
MTDRYAVMGNPIAHSKSPKIHSLFAEQTHQALSYEALLVSLDDFAKAVAEFRAGGGKGLNITVPFKQEAWALEVEYTERAQRAGAVNTLWFRDDGTTLADTTDGIGLVRDLTLNHHTALAEKRILILGAGGAVRGVLDPILAEHPAAVVVSNRTASKARELAALFSDKGAITGCGFDSLNGQQFDLVINGTAASLEGQVPPLPDDLLAHNASCYDMMYSATRTPFQLWATAHGAAHALDGLGMLVEQAAESFMIWRGVRPHTATVIVAVRQEFFGG